MPNPVIVLLLTGQTVFACKWPKSGTKPDCYVRNGFRFNYIVTDRLTLEIPVATEEVSGQYACALVPLEHRRAKRCTLIVDGKIFIFYFLAARLPNLSETIYTLSRTKPDFFFFLSSFFFSPATPHLPFDIVISGTALHC